MSSPRKRDGRYAALARILHAPLFVDAAGRVQAVGGRPHFEAMRRGLTRDTAPSHAEAPSPQELGLPTCHGELSPHLLHCIAGALLRWRKNLKQERATHRRRDAIARQMEEIERLSRRLDQLREWREQCANRRPPVGAPYFLDPESEAALSRIIQDRPAGQVLPRCIAWQARVVFWMSGVCATRRFLDAYSSLAATALETTRKTPILAFRHTVVAWRRRAETESTSQLRKEMKEHIKQLNPEDVQQAGFSARLRNRTFAQHCEVLLESCDVLLADLERARTSVVPAALAAWSAVDDCNRPLPVEHLRKFAEAENYSSLLHRIRGIVDMSDRPRYGALLMALPHFSPAVVLENLYHTFANGNRIPDCQWAQSEGILYDFQESYLRIAAARRLSEEFSRRGMMLSAMNLGYLVRRIRSAHDVQRLNAWLRWLGSVSPRVMTSRMRDVVAAFFWRRYLPTAQDDQVFTALEKHLAPCQPTRPNQTPTELLARIERYRRHVGQESLPKSVKSLMEWEERRSAERLLLNQRQTHGTLTASAHARLHYLERGYPTHPSSPKLRRAAEEAFLRHGLEAMEAELVLCAELKCRTHLGDWTAQLSPARRWDFAQWLGAMDDSQRRQLAEIIAAHRAFGATYKMFLEQNQEWIERARSHGITLEPWLNASAEAHAVCAQELTFELSGEPMTIFQMGSYFDTCLSPGQCNQISVLANAADANKQVAFAFAFDERGQRRVVARQLLAINGDLQMLRYHCYVNTASLPGARREEVADGLAAYSARIAARCGMELSDTGTPKQITTGFWYDDGECEWPEAARAAHRESLEEKQLCLA